MQKVTEEYDKFDFRNAFNKTHVQISFMELNTRPYKN